MPGLGIGEAIMLGAAVSAATAVGTSAYGSIQQKAAMEKQSEAEKKAREQQGEQNRLAQSANDAAQAQLMDDKARQELATATTENSDTESLLSKLRGRASRNSTKIDPTTGLSEDTSSNDDMYGLGIRIPTR